MTSSPGSGSLWIHDRLTYYALNTWTRHRGHGEWPRPGERLAAGRYTVVVAEPKLPWGVATARLARVTHAATLLFLAWHGGRLRGARVRWLCGGLTDEFELQAEAVDLPLCRACSVRLGGSVVINLSLNLTHVVMM